jgi:hypothetical protein
MSKYKVGQKVRVKSITKEHNDCITEMEKTIGKVYTIKQICIHNDHVPLGLDVPGAKGSDDLFWYGEEDVVAVPQFKKGDRVRGCGKSISEKYDVCGYTGTVHNPDYLTTENKHCIHVKWDKPNCGDLVFPENLVLISPKNLATIDTKKIVVGGVQCRKILGFNNILSREDLPEEYLSKAPCFTTRTEYQLNHRRFDGNKMRLCEYVKKSTDGIMWQFERNENITGYSDDLFVSDIIPEENFRVLVAGLKLAGERFIRIKKEIAEQKKKEEEETKKRDDEAKWSGIEEVEI